MQNNIVELKYKILNKGQDLNKQKEAMLDIFVDMPKVYSYVIFCEYKNNVLNGWPIKICISECNEYNTIDTVTAISSIFETIAQQLNALETKYVIGFKQPPLEIMVKLYEPYMAKLAREQSQKWTQYEYDDLLSICKMCAIILYNKDYYLNKALLRKSFYNAVLMDLRHNRKMRESTVSLDEVDDNGLSLLTSTAVQYIDDNFDDELNNKKLEEQRKAVLEFISERQYNELLRCYRSRTVDSSSNAIVRSLRNKLTKRGIVAQINKNYEE